MKGKINRKAVLRRLVKNNGGSIRCQGCGKDIGEYDNAMGIEYIKTKRGEEIVFHAECKSRVWNSKIK